MRLSSMGRSAGVVDFSHWGQSFIILHSFQPALDPLVVDAWACYGNA